MPSSRPRNRASGTSSCESGKKKTRVPGAAGARAAAIVRSARGAGRRPWRSASPHAEGAAGGVQPAGGALGTEREQRRQWARTTFFECAQVSARKGCASSTRVPGPTGGIASARRGGRKCTSRCRARRRGAGTGLRRCRRARPRPATRVVGGRHQRHQRRQTGVLALGEGRLDAAARVVQHPHRRREARVQALRRAAEVELDDLRRARADQEQHADVGPALEQPGDDAVELVVGVGQPGEVAFVDDRGGEARLGEDHHARGRLQQVRAGARADDEEEGVLDLAVQPDDAGQAAEDLALAALLQHRRRARAACTRGQAGRRRRLGLDRDDRAHSAALRAARSFSRNCAALIR